MIFKDELCTKVLNGEKTQTRRIKKDNERLLSGHPDLPDEVVQRVDDPRYEVVKWQVGRTYAVQPGRGKKAVGRFKLLTIREERVQDISAGDVAAEGWPDAPDSEYIWTPDVFRIKEGFEWFQGLWDSINKKPGTHWVDNPPVWVLEFQRLGGEE